MLGLSVSNELRPLQPLQTTEENENDYENENDGTETANSGIDPPRFNALFRANDLPCKSSTQLR